MDSLDDLIDHGLSVAFQPIVRLASADVVVAAELKRRAKSAADESGPVSRFVRNRRGAARD